MKSERARSTMRRRVLFFSHETTLSGAPVQLLYLIKSLNPKKWECVFASREDGPIAERLRSANVRVELDPDFLAEESRAKLRKLCRGFDLVVANTITSWAVVEAAAEENVPAIWYIHETAPAAALIQRASQVRDALHRPRLIVVPTQQTARLLRGATRRTRIEVVPYGIPDIGRLAKSTRSDKVSFVTLGSFEPRKGQDVLLDAIELLSARIKTHARFRMAGRALEPEFFARLRERAARLSNVELLESLNHDDALELLAASDALICSSRDETMPITILEATSLGKAIVSSDVGGIAEWIHDNLNGLLVPTEDPQRLADAIARCVQDRQLLQPFGRAARQTYEHHFRLERFTADFEKLMEEALGPVQSEPASAQRNYERWLQTFDQPDVRSRLMIEQRVRQLMRHPLISVVLPVYNPDLKFLRTAIESVRTQIYSNWQLCIADDASTNPEVRAFLEEIARSDSRIKVVFRKTNGHISVCSNSALELASGEWCALLDQDDALSEDALACVAEEIVKRPDAGLIYSDEDKIDNSGARSNPFFKTDWNPQLFLGQNYINHLGVYRRDLLRRVGGFREGFEGSQDYDLVLRCVEKLKPHQIRHIPRILYHWRMAEGSLAAVVDAKPYAKDAARRAINDHLKRCGIAGRAVACPENIESHRVIYKVAKPAPKVSLIIPTRDRVELLRKCIDSLRRKTGYAPYEIIIVDNDSEEPATLDYFERISRDQAARVIKEPGEFNFSRLINAGANVASGKILAFLNNDIEITDADWLREMVSHAARPEVGAVGARLWYSDGTLQHGGAIVGLGGVAGHVYHRFPRGHPGYFNRLLLQQNYSAVTAACMLVRKKVFVDLGGFDEVNLQVSFNDIDFCLRLRERGLQTVWTPYANLIHHESASRGHQPSDSERAQFLREAAFMQEKWGPQLFADPFYNPNFSLDWPGFDFAYPPRWPEFLRCTSIAA